MYVSMKAALSGFGLAAMLVFKKLTSSFLSLPPPRAVQLFPSTVTFISFCLCPLRASQDWVQWELPNETLRK